MSSYNIPQNLFVASAVDWLHDLVGDIKAQLARKATGNAHFAHAFVEVHSHNHNQRHSSSPSKSQSHEHTHEHDVDNHTHTHHPPTQLSLQEIDDILTR